MEPTQEYGWRMLGPDGPTGTEAEVCSDIAIRQAKGVRKYGQTVADNPADLRKWLQHAYKECLDQAVYLKRAMAELPTPPQPEKSESEKAWEKFEASGELDKIAIDDFNRELWLKGYQAGKEAK